MTVTLERETTTVSANLSKAVELLEGHWCVGDLSKDNLDKFCAVGALAYVIDPASTIESYGKTDDEGNLLTLRRVDEIAYEIVRKSEEGHAVALEIVKSAYWPEYQKEIADGLLNEEEKIYTTPEEYMKDSGEIDEIIYSFNDSCTSVERVLEVFRNAAEATK